MDYLYIEKTSFEIDRALEKKRISSVYLSEKKLSIGFGKLYLNCYFGTPNALFLSEKPVATEEFPHLNPIKGAYLKEVSMPYPDRVVELSLVKILSPTQFEKYYLIFELTGKNANLFLLDSNRRVKFLLRPVLSSVREISLKEEYRPPPLDKKPFEELSFGRITPEGIERSLHKYALYISPLNAKEIAEIYRKVGDLKEAYRLFMERHRKSDSACLYYREGKPAYLTTFPYLSLQGLEFKEFSGEFPFSRAWEEFFRERVLKEEIEAVREKILRRLRKRKEALLKELSQLKDEKELLKEAEEKRRLGELLKVSLQKVKPGATEVELYDYGSGEKISVPLDPSLSPQKNMEAYFKAYRKLKRKAQVAAVRREEIREELVSLDALFELISSVEEIEKLKGLSGELKKGERGGKGLSLRSFTLPSGRKIVVGRSSRENELISLRLSNPWDLWFHAKGIPGSHVILKLKKGEEPTEEDILLSASAAAYYSKGRYSGKVPVDYTFVKNLRKPPKSPVGFVTYSGERTVWVKPEVFEEVLKPPKEGG
ncbi:Rqc2 family fibronectin-binding protein [Thermovibrio sp.]